MKKKRIDAVIFDLDGVITDTAEYHFLAWKQLADELGINIDEALNERLKGISRLDSLELILREGKQENNFSFEEKAQLADRKNRYYSDYLTKIKSGDILPGILPLISQIKDEGIKIGLASVSRNAGTVLKSLQLEDAFDYCVDAGKIKNSKPNPEIFLTACQGLNVSPENSIGIEDAIAGIEAIKASKMFAVGVGNYLDRADYRVDSTDQLQWEKIKMVYE